MIQISYLSKTSSPMSAAQLVSLLQQCHANNTARGVTGMLFYGNGTFLQVIEGEATTVDELVGKIARDPAMRTSASSRARPSNTGNTRIGAWASSR